MDKKREAARKAIAKQVAEDLKSAHGVATEFFHTKAPTEEMVGLVADALRGEDDEDEGVADLLAAREAAKTAFGHDPTPGEVRMAWSEMFEDDEDFDDEDDEDDED